MNLRALDLVSKNILLSNVCFFLGTNTNLHALHCDKILQRHTSSLRKSMLLLLFLLHFVPVFSQTVKNQAPTNTIAYHLKKATALLQHNADSAFLYANKANKLITNETSNQEKSEVYLCLGNINSAQGNYASALKHYFNTKKLAEQAMASGKNRTLENTNIDILIKIGISFFYQKSFDQALHYYDEALQNTLKLPVQNAREATIFKQKIFNNIAAIKIQQKQFDKALEYYQNSLKINASIGDQNIASSVNNNMGICYMEKKEYTLAKYYLEKSLDIRLAQNDTRGIAQCYNNLGKNNALMGNTQLAKDNLLKALAIGKKLGSKESKLTSLQSLTQLYEDTHDYQNAFHAQQEAEIIKDSLYNIESVKKIAQLELQHKFDKQKKVYELELKRRETEQQKKQLIYLVVASTLLFLLIILSLLVYLLKTKIKNTKLQKDKLQLEHLNISLEKQKLTEELEFKNRELTTNVMYLLKKNEFINGITEKLIESKHNFKAENQKVIQEIINQLKSSSDQEVWSEFETHFTQVHADFYNKLQELFPNLSSNEKKLCAFLRLNLSTKDISAITYQSVNSITVARSRLRKKLNIQGEDTNLINFLMQL
jgi:tetratricopeptide (TPR) repeat protein